MRMSKEEVKEETKSTEGDPQVKSRVRGIQRRIAYRRMMQDVPTADVVVTNPTHLAVALRYDVEEMNAPTVVAKGADLVALKIKEIALAHRVPVVEDRPLAQALYRSVEIGGTIPEKLFQAVAQLLAYIYRLRQGQPTLTMN
jgi:flagellar biosynthetic protein FlhB